VYLSIGNIEKAKRHQPTARAMVLVGHILVCKLECFSKKKRAVEGYHLFYEYMRMLLKPSAQSISTPLVPALMRGSIRTIFPILSVYITDYPEQFWLPVAKKMPVQHAWDQTLHPVNPF